MKVWGMTDTGLVRKDNQDAYAMREKTGSGHTLCVVCDGMGGTSGGRLASHIAVDIFMEEMEKNLRPEMTPEELKVTGLHAVSTANSAIREAASRNEECRNMGTTLVAAISFSEGAVILNVGDSRAYHVSGNGIVRVTRDHSLVESMVERGDITAEEARRHPNKNLITRALGPDEVAECDGYIRPMSEGDYLLLCTDGLVDTVTDQEMLFEIIHGDGPDSCLQRLLEISKSRGASDNVTAVLAWKE